MPLKYSNKPKSLNTWVKILRNKGYSEEDIKTLIIARKFVKFTTKKTWVVEDAPFCPEPRNSLDLKNT